MLGYYYGSKGTINQSETMQTNHLRYTDELRDYHSHMTNVHMPTPLQMVNLFDKYGVDLSLFFTAVKHQFDTNRFKYGLELLLYCLFRVEFLQSWYEMTVNKTVNIKLNTLEQDQKQLHYYRTVCDVEEGNTK
jgi:hypothetical protein